MVENWSRFGSQQDEWAWLDCEDDAVFWECDDCGEIVSCEYDECPYCKKEADDEAE